MSLDRILNDIDNALLDLVDHFNRLLTVLTFFLPLFIVTLALILLMLISLLIAQVVLQFKRYNSERGRHIGDISAKANDGDNGSRSNEERIGQQCRENMVSSSSAVGYRPLAIDPPPPRTSPPTPNPIPPLAQTSPSSQQSSSSRPTSPTVMITPRERRIPITLIKGGEIKQSVWFGEEKESEEERRTTQNPKGEDGSVVKRL